MRIPDDMKWDSFDEDEEPRMTKVSPYDRIRIWFEDGGSEGYNPSWAQLINPAVDAYVATKELLEYLSERGIQIDEWPEEYDVAPLLRRSTRSQHKQQ